MKKIVNITLILIMLVAICMLGTTVYAKSSATMQLNTNYNGGTDVVVEAKLSDLTTDRGVIALGAVLEYNKNVLEFKEIAGQNGWIVSNDSYNPENGKIIADRNAAGKTDEVVFTITFKVKNMNANSANITLKEIEMGDGATSNGVAYLNSVTKTITVKETDTSNPNPGPGTNTQPSGNGSQTTTSGESTNGNDGQTTNSGENTNSNNGQNNKNNKNNKVTTNNVQANGKLPKTGQNNIITIAVLVIIVALVAGGVCYIKLHKKED